MPYGDVLSTLGTGLLDVYKIKGQERQQAYENLRARGADMRADQESKMAAELQPYRIEQTKLGIKAGQQGIEQGQQELQAAEAAQGSAIAAAENKKMALATAMLHIDSDKKFANSIWGQQAKTSITAGDINGYYDSIKGYTKDVNDAAERASKERLEGKKASASGMTEFQRESLKLRKNAQDQKFQQASTIDKYDTANKASLLVDELSVHPGMKSAVGVKGISQGFGLMKEPVSGTDAAGFVSKLNSLKSLLTLENMGKMKGVLSDSDMKVLQSAATALDTSMKENEFQKELSSVKGILARAQERIKSQPDFAGDTLQQDQDEFDALWGE